MNIYKNNKGYSYEIIGNKRIIKNRYVVDIKFIETGYIKTVRNSDAISGSVKDDYAKDICGVACKGAIPQSKNKKAYSIWKNMIQRCYSKNNPSFKYYGEIGVCVSDEWLCYENFLRDIKLIDGYDDEKFKNNEIELDKDSKFLNNKVYSLENCSFISRIENVKLSHKVNRNRNKPKHIILVTNKHGESNIFYNIPAFAKENNLTSNKIYECINGNKKTYKGYSFKKIGENKYD